MRYLLAIILGHSSRPAKPNSRAKVSYFMPCASNIAGLAGPGYYRCGVK